MLTRCIQKTGRLLGPVLLIGLAGCGSGDTSIAPSQGASTPVTANNVTGAVSAAESNAAADNAAVTQIRLVNSVTAPEVPINQGSDSILFVASAPPVTGQAATSALLSWDGATRNTDGSSLTDLAGYRVYQGSAQQLTIIQQLIFSSPGGRRSTTISGVADGNNCFAITAFDTANNESTLSAVTCLDLASTPDPVLDDQPSPPSPSAPVALPSALLPAANLALLPSEPPAPSPDRPIVTGLAQISRIAALATVRISWLAPNTSSTIRAYSIYRGTQSQLTKVAEIDEIELDSSRQRVHDLSGVPGDQTCIALTAITNDGNETALGNIFCATLDPLPVTASGSTTTASSQLRPFNVNAVNTGGGTAEVQWDRPSAVIASAVSATSAEIASYDVYQGSTNGLNETATLLEPGDLSQRRSFVASELTAANNCFAIRAIDVTGSESALSETACTTSTDPLSNDRLGVSGLSVDFSSDPVATVSWDTPTGIVAPGDSSGLVGYTLFQGNNRQLFRVADIAHNPNSDRQSGQSQVVAPNTNCFALTAYDNNGNESPLSLVQCVNLGGELSASTAPEFTGVATPTSLSTSAIGGSSNIVLSWLASGVATHGTPDPAVSKYNVYQGNSSQLSKVAEVTEEFDPSPTRSVSISNVNTSNSCFAITAQTEDLTESALSAVVCRDE